MADEKQTQSSPEGTSTKKGMSTGAKAGIGIGIGCFVIIIVIIIIVAVVASRTSKEVSEKVGEVTKQEEELKSEYAVNDVIKSGDKTLAVTSFAPFATSNEFDVPPEGKERYMVGVTITNESDQPVSYNCFDFKIEDSNGNRTDEVFAMNVPNKLNSGELAPGGKVSGNMVFEVPTGDTNLKLICTPSFWSNKRISVKLQ